MRQRSCAESRKSCRRDRCPKTSNCFFQRPSRIHSAHIGQEVDVHYRWHPLYGRRLRVEHSEQRASGRVIHVEVAPGTVTILPDWMVDASICAGMAIGAPRISMDALRELRLLLLERGFRRSFCDDSPVVQENRNEQTVQDPEGTGTPIYRAAFR